MAKYYEMFGFNPSPPPPLRAHIILKFVNSFFNPINYVV